MAIYLDSSAIVKLAFAEAESAALRHALRRKRDLVSSAFARTEVLRALLPAGSTAIARGRAVLTTIDLVRVNDRVLDEAAQLAPHELRTLDAIHLATAQLLGPDLKLFVTYDERLAAAAEFVGIRTTAPT